MQYGMREYSGVAILAIASYPYNSATTSRLSPHRGYFGGGTIDLEAQLLSGMGRSSTEPISWTTRHHLLIQATVPWCRRRPSANLHQLSFPISAHSSPPQPRYTTFHPPIPRRL